MKLFSALAAALTLCGRHGTLIAAASIFIGLAVPPLAAAFRPHLGEAIAAFLRVDPVKLRRHWTQPGLIAAATV
jgi:BASS family bile acid:Na+ symporter